MIRRIFGLGALLAFLCLFGWGIQPATAQDGVGGNRYTTVETKIKQYVWNLVYNQTGEVICEVIVDHEGQPTQFEAVTICAEQIFPAPPSAEAGVPTPGPAEAPFNLVEFFRNVHWNPVAVREATRLVKISIPDIVIYITAPKGPLLQPYVILTAYEPVSEYQIESIQGSIGPLEFVCDGPRCEVPVMQDTRIVFWANSTLGDQSEHVQADVRVVREDEGYFVTVTGMSMFTLYEDACARTWGISGRSLPVWSDFPLTPEELNTQRTLHYLASKLLQTGLVDARNCPGNGFVVGGAPNACGIETAMGVMTTWQNQFDPTIWATGRDVGVPPVLIKNVIGLETQFWPANARYYVQEFGLAQMNQLGADVALRWDQDLYLRVCSELLLDCSKAYASLPSYTQAMVRGALMRLVSAECPNCPNGIDLVRAESSISIIGQTLRANCEQTGHITRQLGTPATYEDMWRFTMVSYHSGYSCLRNALFDAKKNGDPIDWEHVSARLDCFGSKEYVDDLWDTLYTFEEFVLVPIEPQAPTLVPTYLPTPTPAPTISNLSTAKIRVLIYMDINNNEVAEADEKVSGVDAEIRYESGRSESQRVTNGEAVFDASGVPIGSTFTVTVPRLFRTYTAAVPANGEFMVVFRLLPPEFPELLP